MHWDHHIAAVEDITVMDRTFRAFREKRPHEALASSLASRSAGSLPLEILSGLPAWLEDRHTGAGAIPVNALQRITRWLA